MTLLLENWMRFREFLIGCRKRKLNAKLGTYATYRRLHAELLESRQLMAVLTVNTPNDTGINMDGQLSLREAIQVINQGSTSGLDGGTIATQITGVLGSDDTVVFDSALNGGTIVIDSILSEIVIQVPMTIDATSLTDRITINGTDASHGDAQSLIFRVDSLDVGFLGLKLTAGLGAINATNTNINVVGTSVTVDGCEITNHIESGIFVQYGTLTVLNSVISNNQSLSGGGGISVAAVVGNNQIHPLALDIQDSVVTDNFGTQGGGIRVEFRGDLQGGRDNQSVRIQRTTVSDNTANAGGGVWITAAPDSKITLEDSTISHNFAEQPTGTPSGLVAGGGGLRVTLDSSVSGAGSVTYPQQSSILTILRSTISANTSASFGGGLLVVSASGNDLNGSNQLQMVNSTISGNLVTDETGVGGGIFLYSIGTTEVDANLVNLTITRNKSAIGGGFYRKHEEFGTPSAPAGTVVLNNTIISDNIDLEEIPSNLVDEPLLTPGATNIDVLNSHNNLVGSGSNVTLDVGLNNLVNEDEPLLGPLTNNGGPTLTHLPLNHPGGEGVSPAIDAGSNTYATDPTTNSQLSVDQRGFDRIVDGDGDSTETVDIGAVEVQPTIDPMCNLVGDYNRNGTVDAADYNVWRDQLGKMFTLPNEDPTVTPGMVTNEDYDVWRSHFGNTCEALAVNANIDSAMGDLRLIDRAFELLGNSTDQSSTTGTKVVSLTSFQDMPITTSSVKTRQYLRGDKTAVSGGTESFHQELLAIISRYADRSKSIQRTMMNRLMYAEGRDFVIGSMFKKSVELSFAGISTRQFGCGLKI